MNEIKMLDHQKIILSNVSPDKQLFQKELTKSLKWLNQEDVQQLFIWLRENYWSTHKEIIQAAFDKIAA